MKATAAAKMLAETTGGQALLPFQTSGLAKAFHDIHEEAPSEYSVFYKPQGFEANGQFRPIQIAAKTKSSGLR